MISEAFQCCAASYLRPHGRGYGSGLVIGDGGNGDSPEHKTKFVKASSVQRDSMNRLPFFLILAVLAMLLAINAVIMPVYMLAFGALGAAVFFLLNVLIGAAAFSFAVSRFRKSSKPLPLAFVLYVLPALLMAAAVLAFTISLASFGRDHIAPLIWFDLGGIVERLL